MPGKASGPERFQLLYYRISKCSFPPAHPPLPDSFLLHISFCQTASVNEFQNPPRHSQNCTDTPGPEIPAVLRYPYPRKDRCRSFRDDSIYDKNPGILHMLNPGYVRDCRRNFCCRHYPEKALLKWQSAALHPVMNMHLSFHYKQRRL